MELSQFGTTVLVLAAVAGAGVGFVSGVFGVGGGFLLVPVLNIVLKVPMEFAVGAGACQVLGPATTSLLARRPEAEHFRLPLTIAGGLLCGVFLGAGLLEEAKRFGTVSVSGGPIPAAELVVLATYLVLLVGLGCFSLWEAGSAGDSQTSARSGLAGVGVPPFARFLELPGGRASITILAGVGLAVGFLAGLLGMSGGLVLLPGLVYLLGMRTQQAVLTSLVIVWIVAFQSTLAHGWHGNIDLPLVMSLLLGGTIGARLGSDVGVRLGGRQLRRAFGWILLAAAGMIVYRFAVIAGVAA